MVYWSIGPFLCVCALPASQVSHKIITLAKLHISRAFYFPPLLSRSHHRNEEFMGVFALFYLARNQANRAIIHREEWNRPDFRFQMLHPSGVMKLAMRPNWPFGG